MTPQNEILLVKHTYIPGWHLPGGGVGRGETLVSTAIREVREEAGIELLKTPRLHGIFFNSEVSNRDHVAVFVATKYKVIKNHTASREISKIAHFGLGSLPKDLDRGTAARIVEITQKKSASETW